jgi:UDP-N-acetylglucosamine 2-epimerase
MWPNVDSGSDDIAKGIRVFRESHKDLDLMHFFINFSAEDYIKVLYNCACFVGNSSSGIREGAFLGVPAVNIGTRQVGRERGRNVIDVGYNCREIKEVVIKQLTHGKYPSDNLYGDGTAGEKIADILAKTDTVSIQKRLVY